jgi:phosphoribosyl 1,2-cyclic phosphodiesterase
MRIRFWGVRGSTPTPQPENLSYGGNTPCVEFRSDSGSLLIVDCGTGLRALGKSLTKEFAGRPIHGNILISHFHWDHIQGFPFFAPLYQEANQFHVYSLGSDGAALEEVLGGQMTHPYFPVGMAAMRAGRSYTKISDEPLQLDDFRVQAARLNHPQGCLGFRIENNDKAAVFATDNEPGDPEGDRNLRKLCRGADLLIHDSQYERLELEGEKKGWGHSSWDEGVRVCQESGVGQLILFHHDPDRDDRAIDALQARARTCFPNTHAAFEVMEIAL